jgi:hypothetical protein
VLFVRVFAIARVRSCEGGDGLMDRHWSLDAGGGQLRDAMGGLRQKPRVGRWLSRT